VAVAVAGLHQPTAGGVAVVEGARVAGIEDPGEAAGLAVRPRSRLLTLAPRRVDTAFPPAQLVPASTGLL
jgi:hypothetical protein